GVSAHRISGSIVIVARAPRFNLSNWIAHADVHVCSRIRVGAQPSNDSIDTRTAEPRHDAISDVSHGGASTVIATSIGRGASIAVPVSPHATNSRNTPRTRNARDGTRGERFTVVRCYVAITGLGKLLSIA